MTTKKLSGTMAAAVVESQDHGGELVAWRGGWWTYPNCPVEKTTSDGYRVPRWSVATNTVRALIDRGYATVIERSPTANYPIRVRIAVPEIVEPPKRWKPTQAECELIKRAAAVEGKMQVNSVLLEVGSRLSLTKDGPPHINVALVSDDPEFNDTDLDDYQPWCAFRDGIELTPGGGAIVDFYIRRRGDKYGDLEGNVTLYYADGRITRIHGYGERTEYPVK